eukprot:6178676-Pleurochrysis_carterae.AAC.4
MSTPLGTVLHGPNLSGSMESLVAYRKTDNKRAAKEKERALRQHALGGPMAALHKRRRVAAVRREERARGRPRPDSRGDTRAEWAANPRRKAYKNSGIYKCI